MTPDRTSEGPGARLLDDGAVFCVASSMASSVTLALFDEHGAEDRVELEDAGDGTWSVLVPGVRDRQRYGYRVAGPEPCDPAKLLVDPYARAIDGATSLHPRELRARGVETAGVAPRCVVVDAEFDWADDELRRPRRAWEDTVVYETHVKGATKRHPGVALAARGTYEGLASDAFIEHLVSLGVTAVELLPIHEIGDEGFLAEHGRTNYWGYSTLGYFAPAQRYSARVASGDAGGQVGEFKTMVRTLHAAGIEVLLDVVYNHTCEGDAAGPVVSWRGIDDRGYYRHRADGSMADTTGCGNSLNASDPLAVEMVLDSLRYWARECHVDGFRFDLAPTLGRHLGPFDPSAPLLRGCLEDPVLRDCRLIAEPWDLGEPDSYALGRFPAPFREWNGKFRDVVRDFWRSEDGTLAEFATRFAGSSDLFDVPGRTPTASVNFVTSHDGFTLSDLVSYEEKHNEANGHGNLDGTDDNRSWNCGVEGQSDDPDVRERRDAQTRALLATLVLASGVPMLCGGDELGRTQGGNNNAYCQDGEVSWHDWSGVDERRLAFVRRLLALRRSSRAVRRRRFVAPGADEMAWFSASGAPMSEQDWDDPSARCVAILLDAPRDGDEGDDGDLVVLVNGYWEPVEFWIPDEVAGARELVLDTYDPERAATVSLAGDPVMVSPRSVAVLAVRPR